MAEQEMDTEREASAGQRGRAWQQLLADLTARIEALAVTEAAQELQHEQGIGY